MVDASVVACAFGQCKVGRIPCWCCFTCCIRMLPNFRVVDLLPSVQALVDRNGAVYGRGVFNPVSVSTSVQFYFRVAAVRTYFVALT